MNNMFSKINRWHFLIPLTLLAISMIWIFYPQPQQSTILVDIQQREVLRVGLDASFPPFETLDADGQIVGFDVDIAQSIADDLEVELECVNISFDGLYDALKIGRVDLLISGLPVDPYLTEDVAYSVNYFNAGQVLITTAPNIQGIDDLAGKQVNVVWGSTGDIVARQLQKTYPDLVIMSQPDIETIFGASNLGLAIVDAVSAYGKKEVHVITYLTNDWYAVAVKLKDDDLLHAVNDTLNRLIKSGELQRLQIEWF